jgi:hypothetical protein
MMIIKVHKSPDGKKIIAICDADILGKKFEEGNRQLNLASSFYDGENMTEEEIIKNIDGRNFHINAVGKKSIEFCIRHGFIDKDNVMTIAGIPYAQAVIIRE